jgi:hypothetical protein
MSELYFRFILFGIVIWCLVWIIVFCKTIRPHDGRKAALNRKANPYSTALAEKVAKKLLSSFDIHTRKKEKRIFQVTTMAIEFDAITNRFMVATHT